MNKFLIAGLLAMSVIGFSMISVSAANDNLEYNYTGKVGDSWTYDQTLSNNSGLAFSYKDFKDAFKFYCYPYNVLFNQSTKLVYYDEIHGRTPTALYETTVTALKSFKGTQCLYNEFPSNNPVRIYHFNITES